MKLSPNWLALSIVIISILLIASNVKANVSKSRIDLGIQAFEQGDYKRALVTFEKARFSGNTSDALYYNLGATYYKLGYYRKAQRTFQLLVSNSKMEQIAYYNLGLVALKQGDVDRARRRFKRSLDIGDDVKISHLSVKALKRLGVDLSNSNSSRKLTGYVETTYGLDNRVFSEDQETIVALKNNPVGFVNVIGNVDWQALGSYSHGLHVSGDVDISKFIQKADLGDGLEETPVATNTYTISGKYLRKMFGWYNELSTGFDVSYLEVSAYQNAYDIKLRSRKYLSRRSRVTVQYDYKHYTSLNSDYDHLQGNRQRILTDYRWKWYKRIIRVSYTLEFNDRADIEDLTDPASLKSSSFSYFKYKDYSPNRHLIKFKYYQPLTKYWSIITELQYRASLYSRPYEYVVKTEASEVEGKSEKRRDHQYKAQFSLSYLLSKDIRLVGQYLFIFNKSKIIESTFDN